MKYSEKREIVYDFMKSMGRPMKEILFIRYGGDEGRKRWRDTLALYAKFLDEAPYIGGTDNLMGFNLYQALLVFAFYESCGKNVTENEMQYLIHRIVDKKLAKMKKINGSRLLKNKAVVKGIYKFMTSYANKANALRGGEWNNTWGVKINPDGHEEGVAMTLVGCPIADFAKSHGYTDILPKLCALDHTTAEAMHARLIRRHTIAEGAEECDYWYVPEDYEELKF